MMNRSMLGLALGLATLLAACGGDGGETTTMSSSSSSSSGATGGAGGAGGDGGTGGTGGTPSCTTARDAAINPIATVSTGAVTTLATTGATTTLYVDASAGGVMAEAQNPWIYLNLETGTRVDVSDTASFTSTAWDLALKRTLVRTNSGDGGPGMGGAVLLDGKAFDTVTAADAASASIQVEAWFDATCTLKVDPAGGAIFTTFAGWYDYDPMTHTLAPHAGTFIVRGGDGSLYKVALLDYYALPDGTSGMTGGGIKLDVAKLP